MVILASMTSEKMMKRPSALLFIGALLMPISGMSQPDFKNDDERIAYALGVKIMMDLSPFELSKRELTLLQRGMRDVRKGELALDPNEFQERGPELAEKRVRARAEKERILGTAFVEKMKAKTGAKVSESGMVWFLERPGNGAKPRVNSHVQVHYRGTLINGTEFDSSYSRGEPAEFPLDRVIPCWTDGLTMLKVGAKARLICPPEIAYGNRGAAPVIPPGATLIFEVELIGIKDKSKSK
jgi:FKBP-type peptidyl-prolyl cis-trans isomerase